MEPMKTHGYPKKTSEIPQKYSLSIKEEQNCPKRPHNHTTKTTKTCLPTTQDEPPPTPTSTTPTESLTPCLMKKKTHNLYPSYPHDHQPQDPSPSKTEEPRPPLDHALFTNNMWQ